VSDRHDVADDSYSLRFRMKNGVEGSMQQSAGAWGPSVTTWRCAGSKGTVWIDSGKVMIADKSGTRELPVPEELTLPPQPPAADANSSRRLSHFEMGPFTRLCEALRDNILGKTVRAPVALPTFEDGLASMQVMDAIRRSAAQGGALQTL
jgi:predicted dehydrogenase